MNKKFKILLTLLAFASVMFVACEKENPIDPNQIGGDGNLEQNKVGYKYDATLEIDGLDNTDFGGMKSSITVTNNDNGNITTKIIYEFSEKQFKIVDSLLGLNTISKELKQQLLTVYQKDLGFKLDTTDKSKIKFEYDLKYKMTTEGIQDYLYSFGDITKPFTIIKYNANVGDKYEFTDSRNRKITRTVIHKDTQDTYPFGFWNIKVTKIEETKEDPIIKNIIYYANHKFGLVHIDINLKTGKAVNIKLR